MDEDTHHCPVWCFGLNDYTIACSRDQQISHLPSILGFSIHSNVVYIFDSMPVLIYLTKSRCKGLLHETSSKYKDCKTIHIEHMVEHTLILKVVNPVLVDSCTTICSLGWIVVMPWPFHILGPPFLLRKLSFSSSTCYLLKPKHPWHRILTTLQAQDLTQCSMPLSQSVKSMPWGLIPPLAIPRSTIYCNLIFIVLSRYTFPFNLASPLFFYPFLYCLIPYPAGSTCIAPSS